MHAWQAILIPAIVLAVSLGLVVTRHWWLS